MEPDSRSSEADARDNRESASKIKSLASPPVNPAATTDDDSDPGLPAHRLSPTPANWCARHRHRHFEIFWFNSGAGEHFNDFNWYPVAAGTLVLISIGQVHAWSSSRALNGYRVAFSSEDMAESAAHPALAPELPFFFGLSAPPKVSVPPILWPELDHLFEGLVNELASVDPLRIEAARALLRLVLIRAERLCAQSSGENYKVSASTRLARNFLLELEQGFLTVRRVRDYAVRLHVSANHLVETVRGRLGRTPGELLDARLFLEAKRLLFHTSRSISEIAYLLEFKNPSHFGHFFKRHSGCPPGEARRRFASGEEACSFPPSGGRIFRTAPTERRSPVRPDPLGALAVR